MALRRALPGHLADEERPETIEILGSLLGLAHLLHDGGERVQVRPQQADDEVVVVLVEAVTREPYVGREAGEAETLPDRAVLTEDLPLLYLGQGLE